MRRKLKKFAQKIKDILLGAATLIKNAAPEIMLVAGAVFILAALYNIHLNVGLIGTGVVIIAFSFLIGGGD